MRRPVLLIRSEAKSVPTNPFTFNQFRAHVRDRNALNSFPIKRFRTTFVATEGCVPLHPRKSAAYKVPYILPSSVSSNPCVFTLFKKPPGWGVSLPKTEPLRTSAFRSFFGGRGGDAEEDEHGPIEAQDIFVGKAADQSANLGFGNSGDFVHHEAGGRAEPVGGAGLDEQAEKGRVRRIGGEGANGDRSGLVEAIVLKNDHGTRFAGVVFTAGNGPNLAAPHAPFPSESRCSEMASMKSWSALA